MKPFFAKLRPDGRLETNYFDSDRHAKGEPYWDSWDLEIVALLPLALANAMPANPVPSRCTVSVKIDGDGGELAPSVHLLFWRRGKPDWFLIVPHQQWGCVPAEPPGGKRYTLELITRRAGKPVSSGPIPCTWATHEAWCKLATPVLLGDAPPRQKAKR